MLLLIAYVATGIIRSLFLESTLIQLAIYSPSGVTGTVRLAQISDLHLATYGEGNQELVELVASKHPDVIVSTGDMIDARAERIEDTVDLFRRLVKIAPVVYSLGNHEMARQDLYELLMALDAEGVQIVHNNAVTVRANGIDLRIGGLYTAEYLEGLEDADQLDILLCHFPHKLDVYAKNGVPLTFSGHTHGGQFRLPFFDIALYAPGQGWFPQYTKGLYTKDDSHMIVSRGLGNSSFPFRVYNPPEVVIADITYTDTIRWVYQK
ncbi:metallophosphoesterase [Eubacteriales bacterium OttesenSCG-928-A19]|nr:metallophosphoesterase [Eubacteriales bacterium OttesenSCG-928-A19]